MTNVSDRSHTTGTTHYATSFPSSAWERISPKLRFARIPDPLTP